MQFEVATARREEFVDITEQVAEAVSATRRVARASSLVFCPHTTAGITINENADPDVVRDLLDGLRAPRPARRRLAARARATATGISRRRSSGPSVTVPVADGRLALGHVAGHLPRASSTGRGRGRCS